MRHALKVLPTPGFAKCREQPAKEFAAVLQAVSLRPHLARLDSLRAETGKVGGSRHSADRLGNRRIPSTPLPHPRPKWAELGTQARNARQEGRGPGADAFLQPSGSEPVAARTPCLQPADQGQASHSQARQHSPAQPGRQQRGRRRARAPPGRRPLRPPAGPPLSR